MTAPEIVQKESEFEKLRVPIQEIIAFTNTLNEKYQEICFEVLLNFYLHLPYKKIRAIFIFNKYTNPRLLSYLCVAHKKRLLNEAN